MRQQLRTLPLKQPVERVDRDARVIYGVSMAQAVEALGHGFDLDTRSTEQIAALTNGAKNGVKSRFAHPSMSSDGMGSLLGRMRSGRVETGEDGIPKSVADLHLSEMAFKVKVRDGAWMGDYVMDLAEHESDLAGFSIVASGDLVWVLDSGVEVDAFEVDARPENAVNPRPVFRIDELDAVDLVDEAAANRDGMFSRRWSMTRLGDELYGEVDEFLASTGLEPIKVLEFAQKFCVARGVKFQGVTMADKQVDKEKTVEAPVAETGTQLADLQKQMQELQERLASEAEAKQEALARAEKLTEVLDNTNKRVADMERDSRTARFRALSAGWAGDPVQHVALLEALGEGSDLFNAYATQQNAVVEQLKAGGLFAELGHGKSMTTGSAADKLDSKARELMAADSKLTKAQAVALAAERNPDLYNEHVAEMRGN